MSEPRILVREIEEHAPLPKGMAERFSGYGVLGVPFASGHVLAMRRFPASSVGPSYTAVWHRDPDGHWAMWADVDPMHACPRYFGSGLERVIRGPIHISWPDERRMIVRIDQGRELDWEVRLAPTFISRFLSTVGRAIPEVLWRRRAVLSAIGTIAGPALGAGRLSLHGATPNGQWFKALPKAIWVVSGADALIRGVDLGGSTTLAEAGSLGDLTIPRRGLFAVGQGLFEPFMEAKHLPVVSKLVPATSG